MDVFFGVDKFVYHGKETASAWGVWHKWSSHIYGKVIYVIVEDFVIWEICIYISSGFFSFVICFLYVDYFILFGGGSIIFSRFKLMCYAFHVITEIEVSVRFGRLCGCDSVGGSILA